ncbi:MAG TPA: hypothetical protein IAB15_00300 [Candidatus Ornithoclostridium faecigallinarum]|nr:hypothetical protein [Candidatus Ornithoclostridium faecigallinarum]
MTRTRYFGIFAIAVVALVAVTAMLFCAAPTAVAETNAEIKIAPDETSLYAAYDGHVAYTTKDGVLHLSTIGNSVSKGFSGTALDIAMTEDYVFLLTDSSGNKKLAAYSVTDGVLSEEQDVFEKFAVSDSLYAQFANKIDSITVTGNMLTVSAGDAGDYTWFCSIPFSAQALSSLSINLGLGTVDDMATTDAAADDTYLVYAVFDGDLCFLRLPATPVEAQPIETSGKWLSVAALDGEIYAAATDGVYRVVDGTAVVKISDEVADGDIRPYSEGGTPYLLVQNRAESSIVQYSINIDSDELKYYSVFDNVVYAAPTEYPIMTVGTLSAATQGYFSPKNLKPIASLDAGDNVLVLAEVAAEDGSAEGYYYVRTSADADGEMCYVLKSALTLLERGEGWKHGSTAASTHSGLKVLQYPFDGAAVIATVGPKDALAVIGDIGKSAEGWNWLRVSLMTADGTVADGYVTEEDLGPYGPYEMPSFGVDAIVNADKLGEAVNVYSLPEERDELVIDTLTDGEVVRLAAEGLNVDEEWTLIGYETEDGTAMSGYVKTAYLSEGGLTTLQVTLIVVACIVAVVTVVVVIIIAKKRKRERYE